MTVFCILHNQSLFFCTLIHLLFPQSTPFILFLLIYYSLLSVQFISFQFKLYSLFHYSLTVYISRVKGTCTVRISLLSTSVYMTINFLYLEFFCWSWEMNWQPFGRLIFQTCRPWLPPVNIDPLLLLQMHLFFPQRRFSYVSFHCICRKYNI